MCVGSVVVVISVLFSVFIAFMARRRCGKRCNTSCGPPPSAPPQACPSVYTAFPSNMPPSYNESQDTGKYHPSNLSQILTTSTKEGTEKSCWFYFQSHWWIDKQRNGRKTQTADEWSFLKKYNNYIFQKTKLHDNAKFPCSLF